jgi:hypothetical protein
MDAKDHGEHSPEKNSICSLEWIALAIEAARRHKEDEQRETPPPRPRRVSLVMIDGARR